MLQTAESGALSGSGVRGDRAARNCQFWRAAPFGIHPETGSVRAVSALAAVTGTAIGTSGTRCHGRPAPKRGAPRLLDPGYGPQ